MTNSAERLKNCLWLLKFMLLLQLVIGLMSVYQHHCVYSAFNKQIVLTLRLE
jgi:hypothetical protein